MDAIDNKTVDHVGTITSDIQSSILELVNSATDQPYGSSGSAPKEKGSKPLQLLQEMHRLLV